MEGTGAHPRAVRAALFTAVCVTLSTGSHVLLSRAPVPAMTLVPVCAAVFVLSYALAGRERGYGPVAALLVPLELAADTVFTAGQHTCYGAAGGPLAGPLRQVGVDLLCRGGELGTPLARLAAHPGSPLPAAGSPSAPWLLLGAHLAVGLLAAAGLHRGDAALARLLDAVAVLAARPLRAAAALASAALPPPPRRTRPVRRLPAARPLPQLVHCVVRRGPPHRFAATV